ncbi:hypothetical protein [Arthrobacter sp. C152]
MNAFQAEWDRVAAAQQAAETALVNLSKTIEARITTNQNRTITA